MTMTDESEKLKAQSEKRKQKMMTMTMTNLDQNSKSETNSKFEILRQRRAPKAHPPQAEIWRSQTNSKHCLEN